MKILYKLTVFALMVSMIGLTSCDKFLDVNTDPNNPREVPLSLLLTSSQSYLGYTMGGDINRYAGTFVQHFAGVQGQAQEEYDIYNFGDDETNNFWRFGMYAGALGDADLIIQDAQTTNSPHYEGVGKIIMAYGIGVMADLFGRVPYTQAFQLRENLTPSYDNQEDIYKSIQSLLDEAIVDLGQTESLFSPGSDDLVFGGDLDAWIKFANFIKIRTWNHHSVQDPMGSATSILNFLDGNANVFVSTTNDADHPFFVNPNSGNPHFQFEQQRGQIAVSDVVLDELMNPLNDPRVPLYANPIADGVTYTGAPNGTTIQDQQHLVFSGLGSFYGSSASPVPLGTYYEQKFIEAEAAMRAGEGARAYTAYIDAIKANFEKLGLSASYDTYAAQAEVDPGQAGLTMEHIMTQKYIAMFTQGAESWTDWRRTGIPALTAADNNITGGVIPVRFPYPESEIQLNAANVPATTILDPTWFQDGTED